jgi:exodeoxyribonuclease VII small subunit
MPRTKTVHPDKTSAIHSDKEKQTEEISSVATFEENMLRIEAIADSLDSGDVPLADMIHLYEEGMKLITDSRTMLHTAELRITHLQTQSRTRAE